MHQPLPREAVATGQALLHGNHVRQEGGDQTRPCGGDAAGLLESAGTYMEDTAAIVRGAEACAPAQEHAVPFPSPFSPPTRYLCLPSPPKLQGPFCLCNLFPEPTQSSWLTSTFSCNLRKKN